MESERFEDYRQQVTDGFKRITDVVTLQGEKFEQLQKEIHGMQGTLGNMDGHWKTQFALIELRLKNLEDSKKDTSKTLVGMAIAIATGAVLSVWNYLLHGGK